MHADAKLPSWGAEEETGNCKSSRTPSLSPTRIGSFFVVVVRSLRTLVLGRMLWVWCLSARAPVASGQGDAAMVLSAHEMISPRRGPVL